MLRPPIDLDDLIVTIHSAALAEDGWTRIGNDLCRLLWAGSFSLVRPGRRVNIKPWVRLFRLAAEVDLWQDWQADTGGAACSRHAALSSADSRRMTPTKLVLLGMS
jgi:hypothetical protein